MNSCRLYDQPRDRTNDLTATERLTTGRKSTAPNADRIESLETLVGALVYELNQAFIRIEQIEAGNDSKAVSPA